MIQNRELAEVPYPPAPWRSTGQLWMGLFKTDVPVQLPDGLGHLLNPRWLVVALVRYLEGTLRYDELAVGPLARRGAHIGVFTDHIWVNDLASLWGGRRIWGIPKEMADFAWDGDTIRVTDAAGPIATLTVDRRASRLPWIWMPVPGIGCLDGQWVLTVGRVKARLGKAGMRLHEWSPRFPYRLEEKPAFSFATRPFRMTVPPPKLLR
jgi:hypothetical protein